MLLNHSDNEEQETKQKQKKETGNLAKILGLKYAMLKNCKRKNITKTCRAVIRAMFPKPESRAKQRIAKMSRSKIDAIHSNYRIKDYNFIINFEYFPGFAVLMHPIESNTNPIVLNNAISNVFSTTIT
jgi:hypothetical protein